jgi:hypothetical protein
MVYIPMDRSKLKGTMISATDGVVMTGAKRKPMPAKIRRGDRLESAVASIGLNGWSGARRFAGPTRRNYLTCR